MSDYSKDIFGLYETTFIYKEPDNNKTYEFRKYVNSIKIKSLGGMYALYCQEDNIIIFRRSEYLRDNSYKKFSENCCEDFINVNQIIDNKSCIELCKDKIDSKRRKRNYYSLPKGIDRSKLSEDEFQILRRLIKKSLITED